VAEGRSVLGRAASILGWFCVVGSALVIVDMAQSLPFMPEEWWRPASQVQLPPGRFDLRTMVICPGPIGWSGAWGYLLSLVWLPYAFWRALRAARAGAQLATQDRVLLALVPFLIVVVQVLLRATPLKYGYPLF